MMHFFQLAKMPFRFIANNYSDTKSIYIYFDTQNKFNFINSML